MGGVEGIVIGFVIAALVAFLIVRVMMSQMKPVSRKREASAYTSDRDIKFAVKEDIYIRTDVTRRRIENRRQ